MKQSLSHMPDVFPGQRYYKAIQGAVDAILVPLGIRRKVIAQGDRFFNRDAWTWLSFSKELTLKLNKSPTKKITSKDLSTILRKANGITCPKPFIQVATMPERVTPRLALAVIGGGYHEAWHTKYSRRKTLFTKDVQDIIDLINDSIDKGVVFNSSTCNLLCSFQRIIEDIRIERRGNEDFPGALQPMRDLQDFILGLEKEARKKSHSSQILLMLFRDLGLGYNTENGRRALEEYKNAAPEVASLFESSGLLYSLLEEAKTLKKQDTMGSLRLAVKAVAKLWEMREQIPQMPSFPQNTLTLKGDSTNNLEGRGEHLSDNSDPSRGQKKKLDREVSPEDARPTDYFSKTLSAGGANLDLGAQRPGFIKLFEDLFGEDRFLETLDKMEVLQLAVQEASENTILDLKKGERPWRPYAPSLDAVHIVGSPANKERSLLHANKMLQDSRKTVSYLKSRLRVVFRAQSEIEILHGVKKGRRLSNRRLASTVLDLQHQRFPQRAFVTSSCAPDTSLAVAICLDQSGSMQGHIYSAMQCMLVVTDAIESIGGSSLVFGFRDGVQAPVLDMPKDLNMYHRVCGVRYDIFKRFNEKLATTKHRFSQGEARGTTPMSDGIQFGLSALSERPEKHRILFCVTDGVPNSPHEQVITRQLRLAKESHIHVVGIGIGHSSNYVRQTFQDAVWVPSIQELPQPLLRKLNDLCDFQNRRSKRFSITRMCNANTSP